jgi:nicotinic acid phosphoribosyltransferase
LHPVFTADSLYAFDVFDVGLGAVLYERGLWEEEGWFSIVRDCPAVADHDTDLIAGSQVAGDFVSSFAMSNVTTTILRDLPALAWASEEYWPFLEQRRFAADLEIVRDGYEVPHGVEIATLMGPLGDVLLARHGVATILDFAVPLATDFAGTVRRVHPKPVYQDTSSRTFSELWARLAGIATVIAGAAQPDLNRFQAVFGRELRRK